MTRTDDRLAMVLAVVPWLAERGGATVEEISAHFDLPADEVMSVLSVVQCCEIPPYGGDTLGIAVFDDGTVVVEPSVALDRPLRFTADEAFGLLAAGRAALAVPGADPTGPLARALDVLEQHLGGGVAVELDAPEHLSDIRTALAARHPLEITYHVASRDEVTVRQVDPGRVAAVDGRWYLEGWCHRADGRRRFRIDRVESMHSMDEVLDDAAIRRATGDGPLVPGADPDAPRMRLRLPASRRRALEELRVDELIENDDGTIEAVVAVLGQVVVDRALLRIGPGVEVLEPAHLSSRPAEVAAAVLTRYGVTP